MRNGPFAKKRLRKKNEKGACMVQVFQQEYGIRMPGGQVKPNIIL